MPAPKRITHAVVRRLALELPAAVANSHADHADVRDRIFLGLPIDPRKASLKTTPADLDALIAADPRTYANARGQRWVGVHLDRASFPARRPLLLDARKLAAPKKPVSGTSARRTK